MPQRDRDIVTVSPPTFDRTDFAGVDQALAAGAPTYDRAWLMGRFDEGLQIRLRRGPSDGFIMFQPGRLAWRAIQGAERAVVVHDLRVADGAEAAPTVRRLWSTVESFARYYGYAAILAMGGEADGLIAPSRRPDRGWVQFDDDGKGAKLWGRILQGPVSLPSLPRDWVARAASLGAGLVLQSTGELAGSEARAIRLEALLAAHGMCLRHDRLRDGRDVRHRAVAPAPCFSIVLDGVRLGGPELTDAQILAAALAARAQARG